MKASGLSHVLGLVVATGSFAGTAGADTIAHWRFDESSGQQVFSEGDVSGTYELVLGPSGSTASDPVRVTPGRDGSGGALQFINSKNNTEGGRDFLTPAATADVSGLVLSHFTIEAWVNLSSVPSGFDNDNPYTLVHLAGDNSGVKTQYQLRLEAGSDANHAKLTGIFQDSGGVLRVLSHDVELGAGEWHHVAFGRDSSADISKLWVDGAEVVSLQTNDPITSLTNLRFAIGAEVRSNGRFRSLDGYLDDVRISDRLLDARELLVPEPHVLGFLFLVALAAGRRHGCA